MQLSFDAAQAVARLAFQRAGVPEAAAEDAARILTLAEAMGLATHGLGRVRLYCDRIAAGGIAPAARITVEAPAPALRRIDGRNGLGPAVAEAARRAATDAARATGIGAAFVRNGTHLGALAPYLWLAAEQGFAALVTTNTAPMIAPAGGRAPRVGNNPLGIALPHPEGRHVMLDMALSMAARSRIRAAATAGQPIPEGWATDADGHPTTDSNAAMRGLLSAIGGAKGAHLAVMLDMLAGGLSGAAMLNEIPSLLETPSAQQNLGQMLVLIDAECLLPAGERAARLDAAAAIVARTPAVHPATPPRLPGARAIACLQQAQSKGIALPDALARDLMALAGA
ncbi:MAG: Ldh family oxidoreductase [Pseudomonadota bacterium]